MNALRSARQGMRALRGLYQNGGIINCGGGGHGASAGGGLHVKRDAIGNWTGIGARWVVGTTQTEKSSEALNMNTHATPTTSAPNASVASQVMSGLTGNEHLEGKNEQLAPEAWTMQQPTRIIAHKLLDKHKYVSGLRELWEECDETGLFNSKRHFKHCLKLMRARQRVQVTCLGPERPGSPKLRFAARLTKKGARTYLWFRHSYRNQVLKEITDPDSTNSADKPV